MTAVDVELQLAVEKLLARYVHVLDDDRLEEWPDFFVDYLPAPLRPFARPLMLPLDRQAQFATRHTTSLIGISPGYLDWGRQKGQRGEGHGEARSAAGPP